jgi:hypothetical protein
MGYRSEVVLVVGKEVMPQFLATMAKSPEARHMCWAGHDKLMKDYDGEGNILFAWGDIKWYEGYEPIDAISDFMDWCEGEDKEEDFRFIRVGENSDDCVERGYLTHDVFITREVSY